MKLAVLAGIALSIVATPALAQTVGSSDSGNCYPFTCNDQGAIDYYQIYSKTAFPGTVSVNSVTFKPWPESPGTILAGNYNISIGVTSTAIGGNPTGSTETGFYNGSLAPTQFTIAGTSFLYDPSLGNLFLHIVTSGQPLSPNPGQGYLFADYTGTATSRYYTLSNGPSDSGTGALVTIFNATTGAVPEPAAWTMMILGFGVAGTAMRRRRKVSTTVAYA